MIRLLHPTAQTHDAAALDEARQWIAEPGHQHDSRYAYAYGHLLAQHSRTLNEYDLCRAKLDRLVAFRLRVISLLAERQRK